MRFFDPHIHVTSRTTDDLERMASAGVRAIVEPAFWVGQPRTSVGSFVDYFSSLLGWERFRAGQFGIQHYCAIGLNSKEANDEGLAREVLELLPRFALKEGVVAVGEIGFDEITAAEEKAYVHQVEFARETDMVVMVHSPHRDKQRGIARSVTSDKRRQWAASAGKLPSRSTVFIAAVAARWPGSDPPFFAQAVPLSVRSWTVPKREKVRSRRGFILRRW
jgi:predicted metal-dependent TIM-barrel fold hydrolase